MFKILFVCTGNICRTPMAEYLLKRLIADENLQDSIQVESAGTGALDGYPAAEYTTEVCREYGIDTTPHRARSIAPALIKNADLILCMGVHHQLDLIQIFPHFKDKFFPLKQFASSNFHPNPTIDDPYGGPKEAYKKTFQEVEEEVYRIWPAIKRLAGVGSTDFTD